MNRLIHAARSSRKNCIPFALLVLSLFLPVMAAAQAGMQEPLLDHMMGNWVLQGTIHGQQTTHDVTVEWVLNHEYIQLHETAREKDGQGRPAYDAIVFIGWDQKLSQYACLWLDTTSGEGLSAQSTIGRGKREGSELVFLFKGSDGNVFHTTFAYTPSDDTWKWIMDGEENGKLEPFARLTLKRK